MPTQGISNTSAHHATALRDRFEGGTAAARVRLAEHDVVGAGFGGDHGVVPGLQPAAAGDARRLERRDCAP